MRRERIDSLTGLRGVAALWVLARHVGLFMPAAPPWFRAIAEPGYLGVDLFFVLSGFVLAHQYGQTALTPRPWLQFLARRLARIYPMHLAALTLLALGVGGLGLLGVRFVHADALLTSDALLRSLLLVQAWDLPATGGWNVVAWSVSAEWAAYLVFPLLALPLLRLRSAAIAVATICALYAALALALSRVPAPHDLPWGLLRLAAGFPAGILLYGLWRRATDLARGGRPGVGGVRRTGAYLALGALGAGGAAIELGSDWSAVVFLPVLAGPVVYLLARSDALTSPLLQHLGRISYSLYLLHFVLLLLVDTALQHAGIDDPGLIARCMLLTGALAIPVAHLAWLRIEEPARQALVARIDRRFRMAPVRGAPA